MRCKIYDKSLEVGQWVCFSASAKNLASASEEQKKIYEENRFFLVISREDELYDRCRCYLLDMDGKVFDYKPSQRTLALVSRLHDEVVVVDKGEVEASHGVEKVRETYTKAQEHLKLSESFFVQYPQETLNMPNPARKVALEQRKLVDMLDGSGATSPLSTFSFLRNLSTSATVDDNNKELLNNAP